MAIAPERREELRVIAKQRVQELLAMPATRDDLRPTNYLSTSPTTHVGPRGGRYTMATAANGRPYRAYF